MAVTMLCQQILQQFTYKTVNPVLIKKQYQVDLCLLGMITLIGTDKKK